MKLNERRNQVIIEKFKSKGDLRFQYLKAQNEYFKYFLKNHNVKNDPSLYDYRRKIKSEIQHHILKNIHYALLSTAVVYGLIRTIKSGAWSAII